MVLEGSVTVEIVTDDARYFLPLTAGEVTIVPKGHWHRHIKVRDVVVMFFMPGSDEVSTAEDPGREVA